jgi:hypothetical protein
VYLAAVLAFLCGTAATGGIYSSACRDGRTDTRAFAFGHRPGRARGPQACPGHS